MAAIISQVPSVCKKPSTTTTTATSVVNPTNNSTALYSSSADNNGLIRRSSPVPQGNVNGLQVNGKNGTNVEDIKVDIVNVVSTFKTHCHLDLRTLARQGANVELRRDPPVNEMSNILV